VSYLEDVAAGDSLVTSGLSGIFPGGLMVGEVIDVERDVNGLLLDVTIKPAVDLARIEEVYVLVGPATGEGGAAARMVQPGGPGAGTPRRLAPMAAPGGAEEATSALAVDGAVVELQ
jgi:rod shape-determining protein MreC